MTTCRFDCQTASPLMTMAVPQDRSSDQMSGIPTDRESRPQCGFSAHQIAPFPSTRLRAPTAVEKRLREGYCPAAWFTAATSRCRMSRSVGWWFSRPPPLTLLPLLGDLPPQPHLAVKTSRRLPCSEVVAVELSLIKAPAHVAESLSR